MLPCFKNIILTIILCFSRNLYSNPDDFDEFFNRSLQILSESPTKNDLEKIYNSLPDLRYLPFKKNDTKSFKLLKKIAKRGYTKAEIKLSKIYLSAGNKKRSSYWLKKNDYTIINIRLRYEKNTATITATIEECAQIEFELGLYHEYGWGIKKSKEKAIEWYEKAAARDHDEAQEKLDNLIYEESANNNDPVATINIIEFD